MKNPARDLILRCPTPHLHALYPLLANLYADVLRTFYDLKLVLDSIIATNRDHRFGANTKFFYKSTCLSDQYCF